MWHIPFYDMLRGHRETAGPDASHPAAVADMTITVLGRVLFSLIFLVSGLTHLVRYGDMVEYATANGVPVPWLLVPFTGLMILAGGASVLLGFYARLGAWLLVLFLIPTALIMHRFWGLEDPGLASVQMAHFMKNLALAGAALLITRFGGGPGSLSEE